MKKWYAHFKSTPRYRSAVYAISYFIIAHSILIGFGYWPDEGCGIPIASCTES